MRQNLESLQKKENNDLEPVLKIGDTYYKSALDVGDLPSFTQGTESMFNKYSVFSLAKISRGEGKSEYKPDMHFDIKKGVLPPQVRLQHWRSAVDRQYFCPRLF